MRVHVALDERVRDDRLRAADVRPAAAERVAGDLRHGEEVQHLDVEAVQAAGREVGHDVVVEDRRQKRAAQKLREGHVRLPERRDAVQHEALHHAEKPRRSSAA